MLTQSQILNRLRVANCCLAKKVNAYIEGKKNGENCYDYLVEANLLAGYIDSLRCFKLFDDSEVTDSTATVRVTDPDVANPVQDIIISAGDTVIGTGVTANTFSFFGDIEFVLDAIGIEYTVTPIALLIRDYTFTIPCQYTQDPAINMGISIVPDVGIFTGAISGGNCGYPYQDCITDEQVLNIFHAIGKICNGKCTDYVTFEP